MAATEGDDVAGESAREVARRAREQADRLNRRAELFEQGAEGEAETARALAALPPGWTVLHDLRWPGRRLANVDHVAIGPSGIFVIDSKNWTGRITTSGGTLRQNGYNREKTVAGAADAALAVAEQAGGYAPFVHGVITFTGRDDVSAWCRDVAVCCTANLVPMLQGWPARLTPEHVADASLRLDLAMRSATEPSSPPRSRPVPPSQQSLVRSAFDAATRPPAPRRRTGRSSPRRREPSLSRFLVGVALLFGLVAVGPQLASGLGAVLSEQLTKNLGDTAVETCPAAPGNAESSKKPQRSDEKAGLAKTTDTAC